MLQWALRIGILICPLALLAGQDIDANITTQNRTPLTVADQIPDPAERTAFLALFQQKQPRFRQTTFIAEALQRSQCFRKGQVSCGTCHNPHGHDAGSNPTAIKFRGQPDLMCTNCHLQFQSSASVAAHTHHRADSEGSRCVSCHMPRIMDAVLFRARTHQIDDIPNADMTQRFGQEESPNAWLLCHSERSAGWVKEKLAAWKLAPQS